MSRPDWQEYFLNVVKVVATRGACARRQVGCVLVNKDNQILATGYNGRASTLPNCLKGGEGLCKGANAPSGTNLDSCEAIHSEANAIMQCADVKQIHTIYVSCTPCMNCMKMLMNTGTRYIVAATDYPGSDAAKSLWIKSRVDLATEPGGITVLGWGSIEKKFSENALKVKLFIASATTHLQETQSVFNVLEFLKRAPNMSLDGASRAYKLLSIEVKRELKIKHVTAKDFVSYNLSLDLAQFKNWLLSALEL